MLQSIRDFGIPERTLIILITYMSVTILQKFIRLSYRPSHSKCVTYVII